MYKYTGFIPFFDNVVETPGGDDIVWYRLWIGTNVGVAHRTPAYGATDCINVCETDQHDLCGRANVGYNCDCLCHWEE